MGRLFYSCIYCIHAAISKEEQVARSQVSTVVYFSLCMCDLIFLVAIVQYNMARDRVGTG